MDGPLELYSKSSDYGASPEQRAVGKVAEEEEQMYPQRMVRQALRLGLVVTLVALALGAWRLWWRRCYGQSRGGCHRKDAGGRLGYAPRRRGLRNGGRVLRVQRRRPRRLRKPLHLGRGPIAADPAVAPFGR